MDFKTNNLKVFFSEHKLQVIIAAFVLVLFVSFSIASFIHTQNVQQMQQKQEQIESSGNPTLDQARAEADAQLSNELKAKRDNYDNDTKEFIAILSAQLWGVGGSSPYISFTDTTYTESTQDGDSNIHAYVVNALEKTTQQASDPEIVMYRAAIETADSSFFIELTRETATDGNVTYSLASSEFMAPNDLYNSIQPSSAFQVSGLNDEVLQLIDNDETGLNNAVAEYCSQYLPTASNLTWANYVTIDYETNQIVFTFSEGDNSAEALAVIYDRTNKTFTVNTAFQEGF